MAFSEPGAVGLEMPAASYWPDFASAGWEKITIRQPLGGQADPVIRLTCSDLLRKGDPTSRRLMIEVESGEASWASTPWR